MRRAGVRRAAWAVLASLVVVAGVWTVRMAVSSQHTSLEGGQLEHRPGSTAHDSNDHGSDHSTAGASTAATVPPVSSAGQWSVRAGLWSDPSTWRDSRVPTGAEEVAIAHEVTVDEDARVAGLTVQPGARLSFAADRSVTVESTGNLIVGGSLVMRPATAAVTQLLRFVDVDESAFVGGGSDPVASDVGLWVVGDGQLDLEGTARSGWLRAAGDLARGSREIELGAVPTGWSAGDELVVAPTEPSTSAEFSTAFDEAEVVTAAGPSVALDRPLARAHPAVDGRWTAEVADLTRNVRIEGTASGRAHVWVRSSRPQTVKYVALRYLGPRQPAEDGVGTEPVLARYALHFHMAQDGSRGSEVVGTVVRDAGSHAFVAHISHGITFRDTVSYDTLEDAYWWDQSPDTRTAGPDTNDTTYDHAMAALVRSDPEFRGYRLSGFNLAQGEGNAIRDSVAVGVQGSTDAAGFGWPESSGASGHGVWQFSGNIAHNNAENGIFVWQNDDLPHEVTDFAAYYNGGSGIEHGAYGNSYLYRRGVLYGNQEAAVQLRAISAGPLGLRFDDMTLDGAGISDYLVLSNDHITDGTDQPTVFTCTVLRGARRGAVWVSDSGNDAAHDYPTAIDFNEPSIQTPTDVVMTATAPEGSVVRIQGSSAAVEVTTSERRTITAFGPPTSCASPPR